jgi:phosphocarrier protein
VKLIKNGYEVDGKSILGVLSLAAAKGSDIKVITKGENAGGAMAEIEELIESGFGEGV